jgi:hypothetical protein
VHPFPTLLHIKNQEKVSVESLGGVRGDRPIPAGLIASITFRSGARWDPQRRTQADGMLMLLRSAYGMDEPRFAMEAARRATGEALVIEGERDYASEGASLCSRSSQVRLRHRRRAARPNRVTRPAWAPPAIRSGSA